MKSIAFAAGLAALTLAAPGKSVATEQSLIAVDFVLKEGVACRTP